MPAYKRLEYGDWDLVKTDPVFQGVMKGVIKAGRMLHKNLNTPGLVNAEADRASSERSIASSIRGVSPQDSIFGKSIPITDDHTKGTVWLVNGIDGIVNYRAKIGSFDVAVAQIENGLPIRSVAYDFQNGEMFYAAKGQGSFFNGKRMQVSEADTWKDAVVSFAPLFVREGHEREDHRLVNAAWKIREVLGRKYHMQLREYQAGILELCWIADGRMQGFVSSWTTPPNLVSGVLPLWEAGGRATHIDRTSYIADYQGITAGTPKIHGLLERQSKSWL